MHTSKKSNTQHLKRKHHPKSKATLLAEQREIKKSKDGFQTFFTLDGKLPDPNDPEHLFD